ncbi:hypothetical protein J2T57_001426 [Natronocella acetinitrilica]|uniref:Uncharacterized protein n=1 Tax=Natronocella acetinitrilica TaxID=414046 RepID=A0AAE3G3E1_9GAMM|nr:hypothetical protein [Natronocella acetinitrilica]MCP1674324.1 hypothetical protein [Natronocella acetinitrilica]
MTTATKLMTEGEVLRSTRSVALYLPDPAVYLLAHPRDREALIGLPLLREPLPNAPGQARAAVLYADLAAPRYEIGRAAVAERIGAGEVRRVAGEGDGLQGIFTFARPRQVANGQVRPDAWGLILTERCRVASAEADLLGRVIRRRVVEAERGEAVVHIVARPEVPRHGALLHLPGSVYAERFACLEPAADEGRFAAAFDVAALAQVLIEEVLSAAGQSDRL